MTEVQPYQPAKVQQPDDEFWLDTLILALFTFAISFLFGATPHIFKDGDTSWHVAAGAWMLDNGRIPFTEPFSYTAFGKPWIAHEWLSEIIMALAFRGFGNAGFALLVAVSLGLTLFIIGMRLRRWMRPVETCLALAIIAFALVPLVQARPMVFAWPMLAWWTEELLRARERGTTPKLYLIPMMALWVNLHASFAVGLGVAAFFGLDALVESQDRKKAFVQWGLFGVAIGTATLLNPNGVANALLPLTVFTSPTVGYVNEFRPTQPVSYPGFELALFGILVLALWRGARLTVVPMLLALVLLHLALAHIRHQSIFLIVVPLFLLPAMSARWLAKQEPKPEFFSELRRRGFGTAKVLALATLLLCSLFAVRLLLPLTQTESRIYPTSALDSIPRSLYKQRVLNEYALGGPLILRGIPVFMDGRTDVYGDPHFLHYLAIARGEPEAFARAQTKWRFCWAIFPVSSKDMQRVLKAAPGWQQIYADKWATIHVHRPCGSHYPLVN